jgi:hypothetical protein
MTPYRAVKLLLLLGLVGFAAMCGAVLIAGIVLSRANHGIVGPPPADLAGFETIEFTSGSGATIKGWWSAEKPGDG